jgi:hypothetical protein
VGGLLVSQSLTLFVTPVFYTYMEGLQRTLNRTFTFKLGKPRPAPHGAPVTS